MQIGLRCANAPQTSLYDAVFEMNENVTYLDMGVVSDVTLGCGSTADCSLTLLHTAAFICILISDIVSQVIAVGVYLRVLNAPHLLQRLKTYTENNLLLQN